MTNSKTTRRALFASAIALLLCVVMLIGTTFAWFTDTASTSVNTIKSGTLDVDLQIQDENNEWVTAVGKTLTWQKAAGATENEAVLWEPGAEYALQSFKIVNKGNLALKYKVEITGIVGDAKLNEVINWTYTEATTGEDGTEISKNVVLGEDYKLAANAETGLITIKGKMAESAGNEYQNREITGIAITVYATQDTVEYDSFNNTYDTTAAYPVSTSADVRNALKTTGIAAVTDDVTIEGGAIRPQTTEVTISAVGDPVTISFAASYGIAFTPTSADDAYFKDNNEFTLNLSDVTLVNGNGGKTSVVIGQFDPNMSLSDKTFNINGGTFETHSAMTNGAISIAAVSNSTINISNATFIAYISGSSEYASYLTLSDQETYGIATGNTINFTNCTFKLADGTVIDPVEIQTSNPSLFARLFWGINTNTVNFS